MTVSACSSEDEYDSDNSSMITATSSSGSTDSAPTWTESGVQFVKPRIYETGGRKWQFVTDNTGDATTLDLAEKIKMFNLSQSDNKANTATLKEDQNYFAKSTDIFVPGEYKERNHNGRNAAQVQLYRTNMAFLNRINPNCLKSNTNQPSSQKKSQRENGPKSYLLNERSKSENKCYAANKKLFAELRANYESSATETSPQKNTNQGRQHHNQLILLRSLINALIT